MILVSVFDTYIYSILCSIIFILHYGSWISILQNVSWQSCSILSLIFFFFGIFSRFLIFGPTNKHFIHYLLLYTLNSIYFGFFFLDYSSFRGQLRVEEHAVAWPREGKHEEETIEKMHSCIKNPFPLSFSYQFLFFSL